MTHKERQYLEVIPRGQRRVFVVPHRDGYRWFVQGVKGQKGTATDRDDLLRAISAIR